MGKLFHENFSTKMYLKKLMKLLILVQYQFLMVTLAELSHSNTTNGSCCNIFQELFLKKMKLKLIKNLDIL